MKKTEIRKEVAAIRRMQDEAEKLACHAEDQRMKLALATCPFHVGQKVAWLQNGIEERGEIHRIDPACVVGSESLKKGEKFKGYEWGVVVWRCKRGTWSFTDSDSKRFRSCDSPAVLKPWIPEDGDAPPLRFRATIDKTGITEILKPGRRPPANATAIELVELKPGYQVVKNRAKA